MNSSTVSRLLYDSLALSAWKSVGESRWALRVNPSSGNLHPTEGYVICGPVDGLCDTPLVGHYAAKAHALEVRAELGPEAWASVCAWLPPDALLVGLTSILWREAWKYGQRAYRYCQHDVGHAIAAVAIAAAGLGWRAELLDELGSADLAALLGTAVEHDAESEEPEVLMVVGPARTCHPPGPRPDLGPGPRTGDAVAKLDGIAWQGRPNRLTESTVDWGLEDVARAARKPRGDAHASHQRQPQPAVELSDPRPVPLRQIVRQRRSAVAMDGQTRIGRDTFLRMLQRTVACGRVPFSALPWRPRIHLVLFVHRVDDLPAGLYCLVREPSTRAALEEAFASKHTWQRLPECPPSLELYRLAEADTRQAARRVACHQEIASDGCFSLAMLAEYERTLEELGPWMYPRLFWEAGLVGQVLYLEAEAAGIRATGIGCYFDDPMHELLGLRDRRFQDLYHFTVGGAIDDTRLTTLPAYPGRNEQTR